MKPIAAELEIVLEKYEKEVRPAVDRAISTGLRPNLIGFS
jgi:hypothetical protein